MDHNFFSLWKVSLQKTYKVWSSLNAEQAVQLKLLSKCKEAAVEFME